MVCCRKESVLKMKEIGMNIILNSSLKETGAILKQKNCPLLNVLGRLVEDLNSR